LLSYHLFHHFISFRVRVSGKAQKKFKRHATPFMSTPTTTNWLPAKSWQHFMAGGYAHTQLAPNDVSHNSNSVQSGRDVRRHCHESI